MKIGTLLAVVISCVWANYAIGNNFGSEGSQKQILFTENKGQVCDQNFNLRPDILFSGADGQSAFHIKSAGISYQLYKFDNAPQNYFSESRSVDINIKSKIGIYRIDLSWVGANANPAILKDDNVGGIKNYYLSCCPMGALNIKSYAGVTLINVYDNINVHYYNKEGTLKYDYIVAPGANYKSIRVKVSGAVLEKDSEGNLLIKTEYGVITENKPVVMQEGLPLNAEWSIEGDEITYDIKQYDSSKKLIIDPVVRIWGTYYGDAGADYGYSTEVDALNNIYMCGRTGSWANIATTGAHQNMFNGGSDAFIVKMNSNGIRQWCTYYGGSGNDIGQSCQINSAGEVFMAGITQSSVNISSLGSHQSIYGGGTNDAFLVKFNSSGGRQWGTYYGGTGDDGAFSCSLDINGNVYLCGYSGSSSNIATVGSHQASLSAGPNDAMLVKFNSTGVRLWGTYYGGTNNDFGYQCITDATGNVIITGSTQSTLNISTPLSQQVIAGGNYDAFLTKFNMSGVLQWGTYSGGASIDYGYSCSIDALGNIYLAGSTQSTNNISTGAAHQINHGGFDDAFLRKYNSSGNLQWGTYYGGTSLDYGCSCKPDASGNVYLTGRTLSNGMATAGAYQAINGGGVSDAFLVKFNNSGIRQWGTYYGGSGDDGAYCCTVDNTGNVYVSGYAGSPNAIASANSFQTIFGGQFDAFLVKFGECLPMNPSISANNPACTGSSIYFSASTTSTLTLNYLWSGPNSFTSSVQNPNIANASLTNAGTYTVIVYDAIGCSENAIINMSVSVCTGISEITSEINAKLFPNPNTGNFKVGLEEDCSISIINSIGQEVFTGQLSKGNNFINLQAYPDGIYMVRFFSNNEKSKVYRAVKN